MKGERLKAKRQKIVGARARKKSPEQKKERVYKFSPKTRKRMSKAHTGRTLSEATRAKISAARQEREALIKLGFLPKFRHSEKTKAHLRRVMKRLKHTPSKKARAKGRAEQKNRALDKKLRKKVDKGMFDN